MWQIIALVASAFLGLIAVIYGILNYEIRKLRTTVHKHGNEIQSHEILLAVIRKKLDL